MKNRSEAETGLSRYWSTEETSREIRRANARLRHFRGVAACVMGDAQRLWKEIVDGLQNTTSCEEILSGECNSSGSLLEGDRALLLEKLHLLGIQIDYAKRLCEGSIGNEFREEGDQ